MTPDTGPRIPPLPPAERTDEQNALLPGPMGELGIFATLVRHPALFRTWLAFGASVLTNGLLPGRVREVLILRTAVRCRAAYEWAHHVPIAHRAGLTDTDIERIAAGSGLDDADALLVRVADELYADRRVGDATWQALAASYGEQEIIEILLLVGQYTLVAGALNSLGVEIESGYAAAVPPWL